MFMRGVYFNTEGGAGGGASGGQGGADSGKGAGDQNGGGGNDKGAGGGAGGNSGGAGGGEQQRSLRSQLAEHFEGDERTSFQSWAEKYATDKDFSKALNSQRTAFDQRVPLPNGDSKPEDWHKFYTRVGKPETSKDYKFDFRDKKPDDATTAQIESFKEFAHTENLTQGQFEKLVAFDLKREESMQAALGEQMDAFQGKSASILREAWGPDFDSNLEYARAAGQQFADSHDEYKSLMDMPILGKEGGMRVGDHPTLMKMMAKIGRLFAEDTRVRNMHNSGETQTIQAKISEIEEEARKSGRSTAEKYFHERLEPLYKKLYPAKQKAGMG